MLNGFPILGGVHLTLLIGPMVPIPAPPMVIDALQSVQVTSAKDQSGFQLTFAVGKKSPLLNVLLPAGYLDPMITRVIIIATVNGMPNVLMDGIVTNQELKASSEPGASTLTVTGSDLTVLMDIVEVNFMRYPAQPEVARVYTILAKYAALGIVPLAITPIPPDVQLPTEGIATHKGTDLDYLKELATDAGYAFYLKPGPLPGQSIAYFGPDIQNPVPQRAISVNMDAHTNVDLLTFSLNGLTKTMSVMNIVDPATKKVPILIPVPPNINVLKPPQGLKQLPPAKVKFIEYGTAQSLPKAIQKMLGLTANSSDSITLGASLDLLRYGAIVEARRLIGVRGAGIAYDGNYYVNSVTHDISRGEYKMSLQMSRDGLISNTPLVRAV